MKTTQAQAKVLEGLVAQLEKAVARECQVSTNEKLRSNKTKRLREFDVVVRAKLPSRQFIAVFEVQKRSRMVGEPTLEGWIAKARSVGANRLVCVSSKGFAEPAKDLARHEGSFVDLFELVQHVGWPSELPHIEMQFRGCPIWTLQNSFVQCRIKASESGGNAKPGDVVSGQLSNEKPFVWETGRMMLGPMEFLYMLGSSIQSQFPAAVHGGVTFDFELPELPGQEIKVFTPQGLVEVDYILLRASIEARQFDVDRIEVQQYRNALDGRPIGYVVTPIVEKGVAVPFRYDLAIAPPIGEHVTTLVTPNEVPPEALRKPGPEFGVFCRTPTAALLRSNVKIWESNPPPFERQAISPSPKAKN